METNYTGMIVQSLSDTQVRSRLDTLKQVVISIGNRKGWVHDGMTREQALEEVFIQFRKMRTEHKAEKACVTQRDEIVSQIDRQNPRKKEIRVRLFWDDWEQIAQDARKLHVNHNSLVHKWILEGLSMTRNDSGQSQP